MTTSSTNHIISVRTVFLLLATLGYGWIVVDAALDKGISNFNRAVLLIIAIGLLFMLWRLTPNLPRRNSRAEWTKPKAAASVFYVAIGAIGMIGGAIQLLPRESGKADQPNIARQMLKDSLWGETQECKVAYRFKIDGDALKITGEGRPPKTRPFRVDGQIQPNDPKASTILKIDVIGAVGPDGKRDNGGATFTYIRNAVFDELNWADDENSQSQTLFRCNEGASQ
jgi:hypothetical protein